MAGEIAETDSNDKTSSVHDLSDLRKNYDDGESVDRDLFSEQRSNILLIAGDHYSRLTSKYWSRLRDAKDVAQEQKLRLTKNHIYKIMRSYSNSIVSLVPSATCMPQDPKSLDDQKNTELHNDVLNFAKRKYRMKEKVRDWCDDFVGVGEVATKIFFDPNIGKPVGYEQEVDEEGTPQFDEMGQPQASDNLVYSGDFIFETIYGFNLLRDQRAKSMDDSPFLTLRKMVNTKEMKDRYKNDKDKLKCFNDSADGTWLIFDASKSAYARSKDQCMVMETYYKPCMEYPRGYYYFWTFDGVFEEDELPMGIFPIAFAPFDKFQTSPRGRSHIKVLRPFQAEINRSASKIAEHQITLGDDKIITQAGTKLQQGGILPGVRGITVSGAAPQILPGRDGSQYAAYMTSQIDEMYRASLIDEEMAEAPAQMDPYALLFRAASQKKKFSLYTERFEQYLVDVFTIFLELARHYMSDEDLMIAVGKNDVANIQMFREPKRLGYVLSVEPQSDDIESKLGKQLVMNHFIQFAGSQLDKEDLGKLIKTSPYANEDETFADLTSNYDAGTNNILTLERGKAPMIHSFDDHPYFVKRYLSRMRQPDYDLLSPEIKSGFESAVNLHEQAEAQRLQQLKAAEADFIPTGGALVVVDLYVPDPKNPLSSKRARIPYEALNWLIQRLEDQGSTQDSLKPLPAQAMTDIMTKGAQGGPSPGGPPVGAQRAPTPMLAHG